ncbi:MAG: OadG family protein [Dehalobacterium sp.]|jgi:sodium pump decarboxylase gamma subunit
MDVMDNMQIGVLATVIGMGIVFIVLIILSFLISFLNYGVEVAQSKKTTKTPVSAEINEADALQNQEGIPLAIVAAITASVCMITGKSTNEFRFKGIRRAPGSQSMWGMTGTADIIANRQRHVERGN